MTMRKGVRKPKELAFAELERQIGLFLTWNASGDCTHADKLRRALSFYRDGVQCDRDDALAGLNALRAGFVSKKFERNGKRKNTDRTGLAHGIYDLMNAYSWRYNGAANRQAVREMEADIRSLL